MNRQPTLRNYRFVLMLALGISGGFQAQGQTVQFTADAETEFQRGLVAFRRADYVGAEKNFAAVSIRYPGGHRSTAALIMRGNSLYRLNENYEASKVAQSFTSQFPTSQYLPDAYVLLARIYSKIERYDAARLAVVHALNLLSPRSPQRLVESVELVGDSVCLRHSSVAALHEALASAMTQRTKAFLWKTIAERNLMKGDFGPARAAVDTLSEHFPDETPMPVLSRLRIGIGGASNVHVAALLPLMRTGPSSPLKDIGNDVYDGILTAIDRFDSQPDVPITITLDTRDTEHDIQKATDEARELAKDPRVIGILGPIFSMTTTAAARVATANGVPLLTPTANQNGIAGLGSSIFQANPDYEQRGRAMARYAVNQLGYRVVGVLAPSDSYGKFLADAFVKETNALGATVVAVEWYQKGTTDLHAQFFALRRAARKQSSEPVLTFGGRMSQPDIMKLIRLGAPASRVDSLLQKSATVSVRWLLGTRGLTLLDSIGMKYAFDITGIDSIAHPETGMQALYCPISGPEEIGVISSQVAYNGLVTSVLGSGEWNSPPELETNRRYTKGVRFESDSFVDTSSAAYKEFYRLFMTRFHRQPEKNTMYGYDAATLMLNEIGNGATNREKLIQALAAKKNFHGVKGTVSFTPGRVNGALHILQYTDSGIIHLTELGSSQ